MAMKRISRREGQRLRKRVAELEAILDGQKVRWSSEWPASTCLLAREMNDVDMAIIKTARALGKAVIVTIRESKVQFWAQH